MAYDEFPAGMDILSDEVNLMWVTFGSSLGNGIWYANLDSNDIWCRYYELVLVVGVLYLAR